MIEWACHTINVDTNHEKASKLCRDRIANLMVPQWKGSEYNGVLDLVSPLLPYIRYPLMTQSFYDDEVLPTQLLSAALKAVRATDDVIEAHISIYVYTQAIDEIMTTVPLFNERNRTRVNPLYFPGEPISSITGCPFTHAGSVLMSRSEQELLHSWVPETTSERRWALLYRASIHGYSAASFHNNVCLLCHLSHLSCINRRMQCDGVAHTVVVVRSSNGYLCGGYTDVPWTCHNIAAESKRSFLFQLRGASVDQPSTFPITHGHAGT